MKDEYKTKKQLITELREVRKHTAKLEKVEAEQKRIEQALQESEARYRGLFENTKNAVAIYSDETERKQAGLLLLKSDTKFRALVEHAPAAIIIVDEGRFLYVNPAFESITGFSKEDACSMTFWDVVDKIVSLPRDGRDNPLKKVEIKVKIIRPKGG